jgi:hypothetical protein
MNRKLGKPRKHISEKITHRISSRGVEILNANHEWTRIRAKRRERRATRSEIIAAVLCGLCASAFIFLSVRIRVHPWLNKFGKHT